MQVEWKWCNESNKDNFKHKLYMARNLWEEAPLPSYSILFAFPLGLHPNVIFPWDFQMRMHLNVSELWMFIFFSN
jgi:hypothetical protein